MADWLLYEHEDGRHAAAPSAETAVFSHGDPAWHRVGPVEMVGMADRDTQVVVLWMDALGNTSRTREPGFDWPLYSGTAAPAVQRTFVGSAGLRWDGKCRRCHKTIREHDEHLRCILAKHQPCGCVVCTCTDEEKCHGCGAKRCGTHPVAQFADPIYVEPACTFPDCPCKPDAAGDVHCTRGGPVVGEGKQ